LVELLCCLVLLAILGAIAWPGYQRAWQRARRSDAQLALLRIHAQQERRYAQLQHYSAVLGNDAEQGLGVGTVSAAGHYALSLTLRSPGLAGALLGAASVAIYTCDRAYAYSGATSNSIQSYADLPQRRNEIQAVLRYRGQFGPVGVAASFGHVGWTPIRDMTATGSTVKTLRPGNVWMAGLQASAYGFSVGGMYQWGQQNYFWGSQERGDKGMFQYTAGATYTTGPITIGGNAFWGSYAGTNGFTFCDTSSAGGPCNTGNVGQYLRNNNASMNSMRRWGLAAGMNYRLAPGMDLVAEYVRHAVHEAGQNLAGGTGSAQDKLRADIILVGTRLAF
jgi:type II secretory pathway pseudopilin PulG